LVEGGQHPEFDFAAEGGLPDEQAGERGPTIKIMIGELSGSPD